MPIVESSDNSGSSLKAGQCAYIIEMSNLDTLRFDVVSQETHKLDNEITEHPVESGANVSDHVRAELDNVTLEVFVSNCPISPFDRFSYDSDIGNVQASTISDSKSVSVLRFPEARDNVVDTYTKLRQLRDDATLLQVITRLYNYENVVIKSVGIPRSAADGDGARMTIEFKEIRLVETKKVPTPIVTVPRAKAVVNSGAKNTKPAADKESVAHKALESLKGLFS